MAVITVPKLSLNQFYMLVILTVLSITNSYYISNQIISIIVTLLLIYITGYRIQDLFVSRNTPKPHYYISIPITTGIVALYIFGLLLNLVNLFNISHIYYLFYFIDYILCRLVFKKNPYKLEIESKIIHVNLNNIIYSFLIIAILSLTFSIGYYNYTIHVIFIWLYYLLLVLLMVYNFIVNKKKSSQLFFSLIIIAFSLCYTFLNRGVTLIGRTDINKELFIANHTITTRYWNPNEFKDNYNTVLSITILPTVLFFITGLNPEALFGTISPIFLSFFIHGSIRIFRKVNKNISSSAIYSLFTIEISFISFSHQMSNAFRQTVALLFFISLIVYIYECAEINQKPNYYFVILLFLGLVSSHWGVTIFSFVIIVPAYLLYLFSQKKKLIEKRNLRVIILIIVLFSFFICWYVLVSKNLIYFIQHIFKTICEFVENPILLIELYKQDPILARLLPVYKSISIELLIISNLCIVIFYIYLILSSTFRVLKSKKLSFSFYISIFIFSVIVAMLIFPLLSVYYSPVRIFYQFYPFLIASYSPKMRFRKVKMKRIPMKRFHPLIKNFFMYSFIISFFLIQQGIPIAIEYNDPSNIPTSLGETYNLLFDNKGDEAWKWVITNYDLKAISWLQEHKQCTIFLDSPRFFQVYSRVNWTNPINTKEYNVRISLLFSNFSNVMKKGDIVFISSQNLASGFFYFFGKTENQPISLLNPILKHLTLIYNDTTLIYEYK